MDGVLLRGGEQPGGRALRLLQRDRVAPDDLGVLLQRLREFLAGGVDLLEEIRQNFKRLFFPKYVSRNGRNRM